MAHRMKDDLEEQVARLLEEAERPMRVEEILPHLGPLMPSPNDVADVLQHLAAEKKVEREGSFFHKATPVPLEKLFPGPAARADAAILVAILRETSEGLSLVQLLTQAARRGVPRERALDALTVLRTAGEAFSAGGDKLRIAKP